MRTALWPILAVMSLAFWSSGAARYFHEVTEHSESTAASAVAHEEADDSRSTDVLARHQGKPFGGGHAPSTHRECVMCQTLAAMSVERTVTITLAMPLDGRVDVLSVADWRAPTVRAAFDCPTTGPPA